MKDVEVQRDVPEETVSNLCGILLAQLLDSMKARVFERARSSVQVWGGRVRAA